MKIKREVKLALTAIVAVFILIWGINFLRGLSIFERRNVFYGVYERVDGLKVSSGVVYRGYQVGQVMDISFTGRNLDKVLVKFSVQNKLTLPANTLAMIQNDGLMGTKIISLIPGDAGELAHSGDTLPTSSERGLMEEVSMQLAPLKQRAEQMLGSLDSVLIIVQGLFNEGTKQNLSNSFNSIDKTLKHLQGASGNLDTLMQTEATRVGEIIHNINSITYNLKSYNGEIGTILSNLSTITDSIRKADLKQTIGVFEAALTDLNAIINKMNQGEGSLGALLTDEDLYYNLSMTGENLNRLLVDLRNNPKRYLRLSLIDFSGKSKIDEYGIVIHESDSPLGKNDSLYGENAGLLEIKYKGKYLYIRNTFKKLKQAQRCLEEVMESYEEAYIVKIDFM